MLYLPFNDVQKNSFSILGMNENACYYSLAVLHYGQTKRMRASVSLHVGGAGRFANHVTLIIAFDWATSRPNTCTHVHVLHSQLAERLLHTSQLDLGEN